MKKFVFLSAFCILISLLSGCKSQFPKFIKKSSCLPPCFFGISPGETNKNELIQILDNLDFIDQSSIKIKDETWKIFSDIVYFSFKDVIEARVYLIDGIVAMISFEGELGLTFSDAVKRFGGPEIIMAFNMLGSGRLLDDPKHTIVYALDPENGINIGYDTADIPRRWRDEIKPEIKISMIDFFNPDAYIILLDAGMFSMGLFGANEAIDMMRPWTGYGMVTNQDT